MPIDLDPEERAFRDACGKLAADLSAHWALGRGPADVAPPLPAPADWARLADAGWLGLCLHEENGGAEAGTFYASLLVTEVARAKTRTQYGAPIGSCDWLAAELPKHPGPFGTHDDEALANTQRWHRALADLAGPSFALEDEPFADYIWSRAQSVYGGTQQIQRRIVAQRVLNLPRS